MNSSTEHSDNEQSVHEQTAMEQVQAPENELEKVKKPRKKRASMSEAQRACLAKGRELAKLNQKRRMLSETEDRLREEGILEEFEVSQPCVDVDPLSTEPTKPIKIPETPKASKAPKTPKKPKKKKIVWVESESDTSSEEEIVYKKRGKSRNYSNIPEMTESPVQQQPPPPVAKPVMVFR